MTVDEMIAEITQELSKGQIFEAPVVGAAKSHYEGLCNWETGAITVNPSVSVVDTLIHELIHRRYPRWSEIRVRRETWRIMRQLSPEDVSAWYKKYKRLARKRRMVRLAKGDE